MINQDTWYALACLLDPITPLATITITNGFLLLLSSSLTVSNLTTPPFFCMHSRPTSASPTPPAPEPSSATTSRSSRTALVIAISRVQRRRCWLRYVCSRIPSYSFFLSFFLSLSLRGCMLEVDRACAYRLWVPYRLRLRNWEMFRLLLSIARICEVFAVGRGGKEKGGWSWKSCQSMALGYGCQGNQIYSASMLKFGDMRHFDVSQLSSSHIRIYTHRNCKQ